MNPHLALLIAQIIGSLNSVISRAAFVLSPEADPLTTSVPTPLTFAVWRALIASIILTILRFFIVKRPAIAKKDDDFGIISTDDIIGEQRKDFTNGEGKEKNQEQEAVNFFKAKAAATPVPPSASPSSAHYSLSTPMPHPQVKTILQVCLLGAVVITGNFSLFFFGVAFTDAITLASMMCMIPPICFVLGFLMGMETFTVPKALSTLLVVCGNFVMAHAWRMIFGTNDSSNNSIHHDDEEHHHPVIVEHPHGHHQEIRNDHHHHHHHGGESSPHQPQHSYFLGVFFLFMAFVCWSLYLLLQRAIVKKMHLLDFLFYLYWSALAGLLTISVFHPEGDSIFRQVFEGQLTSFAWCAILYAGCIQSIGTYFLVSYATVKADSSLLAALYNGLMPLFVTVEAIILLGESMDEWQVIGGGIVVCGWVSSMIAISKDSPANGSSSNSNEKDSSSSSSTKKSGFFEAIANASPTTAMMLQQVPFFSPSPPNASLKAQSPLERSASSKDLIV